MDCESLKQWIDKVVERFKETNQLCELIEENQMEICFCKQSNIQLFRGIETLAEATGKELMEIDFPCADFPYKYLFVYKEVLFIQISEKRLGKYAGDD